MVYKCAIMTHKYYLNYQLRKKEGEEGTSQSRIPSMWSADLTLVRFGEREVYTVY